MTENEPTREASPIVRLLIEAGPLVVFFLVNAKAGDFLEDKTDAIFAATAAFMVAILISLLASWRLERRLPTMPLVTAVFVVVFGGLTLWLQDETFIKLKPTIVNGLFALILFGGLAVGRAFLKPLLGTALQLDDTGWRILTFRWAAFFVVLAVLNEIVWRNASTDAWVTFKVFGIMPLTMVFVFTQMGLIQRHQLEGASAPNSEVGD